MIVLLLLQYAVGNPGENGHADVGRRRASRVRSVFNYRADDDRPIQRI